MKRSDVIRAVMKRLPEGAVTVSCNGLISRDTFAADDRERNFYMIGSMGLAASIGLGAALCRRDLPVVVLDGDGNALMGLGNLASAGAARPSNFYHLILDSLTYESTGGQSTISPLIAIEAMAKAAGYARAERVEDGAMLEDALTRFFSGPGPACLLVVTRTPDTAKSPRISHDPPAIARRVRTSLMQSR